MDRGTSSRPVRAAGERVRDSLCTLSPQNLPPSLHPIQVTFQNDAKNLTASPHPTASPSASPPHPSPGPASHLPPSDRYRVTPPTLRESRPNRQRVAFQRPDEPLPPARHRHTPAPAQRRLRNTHGSCPCVALVDLADVTNRTVGELGERRAPSCLGGAEVSIFGRARERAGRGEEVRVCSGWEGGLGWDAQAVEGNGHGL